MRKIERDLYDKIIGRYDINMTYISKIMSYREFSHLVKVSQNLKSLDLRNTYEPRIPDLKKYLIWTHRTISELKKLWDPGNAYFAILSPNLRCHEKFDQVCEKLEMLPQPLLRFYDYR